MLSGNNVYGALINQKGVHIGKQKGQIGQAIPSNSKFFDETHSLLSSYFENFKTYRSLKKEKK